MNENKAIAEVVPKPGLLRFITPSKLTASEWFVSCQLYPGSRLEKTITIPYDKINSILINRQWFGRSTIRIEAGGADSMIIKDVLSKDAETIKDVINKKMMGIDPGVVKIAYKPGFLSKLSKLIANLLMLLVFALIVFIVVAPKA